MGSFMKTRYIVNSLLCIGILQFLLLNWGVETIGNEVMQASQWCMMFLRGGVFLVMLLALLRWRREWRFEQMFGTALVVSAVMESVYAIFQVYGLLEPNNALFKLTGTFYNPGPLGGYLAMAFVVALNRYMSRDKVSNVERKCMQIAMFIILFTLLVTLSRTAWIAALVGVLFVLSCHNDWVREVKRYRRYFIVGLCALLLIFSVVLYLKWDSAIGRLFLWYISFRAILDAPLMGHGSFTLAYGEAQERYFATGSYSEKMAEIAGSPEYAFNEYLDFGVRYGLIALIVLLVLLVIMVRIGIKKRLYEMVAVQIVLMVFAIASYPMHIPVFFAVAIVLVAGVVVSAETKDHLVGGIILPALLIMGWSYWEASDRVERIESVDKAHKYYILGEWKQAANLYSLEEKNIPEEAGYLFEYGHALHQIGKWEQSTTVLLRVANFNSDPMIFNIIGENMKEIGNFEYSEMYYKKSVDRLPNRMYPHFLLFQLYSTDDYWNEEKRKQEADIILTRHFKVESTATKEMRQEVKKQLLTHNQRAK